MSSVQNPQQTMSVCYECQQDTSGRCWRHRNSTHINFLPPPSPPTTAGPPIGQVRDALRDAACALAAASEELDALGSQVAASDAHQAYLDAIDMAGLFPKRGRYAQ